jgi:hypothetical protein
MKDYSTETRVLLHRLGSKYPLILALAKVLGDVSPEWTDKQLLTAAVVDAPPGTYMVGMDGRCHTIDQISDGFAIQLVEYARDFGYHSSPEPKREFQPDLRFCIQED